MSIHSMPDVPGVDIAELLRREEAGEDSCESQDNPNHEDYLAMQRADASYYRTIGHEKSVKRSRWNWSENR